MNKIDLSEQDRLDQTDAIARERENFRNLFRQTPEMVCILSGPEHRFEFVNDAHIKALGFDATGMTVRHAQPESVEVHGILDEVYTTGKTAELREIPVTVTDRLRFFNLTYAAKRNSNGVIDGVMILGTEITDQFLNREILRSQNLALEMTMNGSSLEDVLTILARSIETNLGRGVKGSILLYEKESKTLRHGAAPSLPKSYNDAIDGIAIGPTVGSCGTAAYTQKEVMVTDISTDPLWKEFRSLALQHDLTSCWSKPIFASNGKLIGTFALYNRPSAVLTIQEKQIITLISQTVALVIERSIQAREKHQTQLALSESEELYRASREQLSLAIEVARVGFYDWDVQKDEITFSPQMLEDWGITGNIEKLEEALALIHEDDRERVKSLIEKSVEENTPYHTEYRVVRPDGELSWMDVRGQIHYNSSGKPVRFFGTSVNITDSKIREAKLKEAQESAESASAAKGLFLANMSHEIRTPLGAITGFLELLKDPQNTREQLMDYVGVIDRNSKQLLRIVDDVLDLSKIEAGKFVIEKIDFSLSDLLQDFSSLMSFKAREKGLVYDLKVNTALPSSLNGDPTRLRQILTNVVGNAIKFTEKGEVSLEVNFKDGFLNLKVKDTGCGIAEEAKKHLFQPFSQADNSTTRLFGGTGLGLSLTRRLSEAMGGEFSLQESKVNVGSLFVVRIPFNVSKNADWIGPQSIGDQRRTQESVSAVGKLLEGLRILVVEDSPDNQRLMSIILGNLGAKIKIANNGLESIELVNNENFDVILMDIQMPIMDGHEATRKLREQGVTVPIVALTAHAMKEEYNRCIASGFSDFLSKPLNRENLINLLREVREKKEL